MFWDWAEGGNVEHIAEHALTPEQVDQALVRGFQDREKDRGHPDRWVVGDFTDASLFIVVAFDLEWIDEFNSWLVTPITAYEPHERLLPWPK